MIGPLTPVQQAIVGELYTACQRLGAKSDLLALIGSFGDSLEDETVLDGLLLWNKDAKDA